jgi:hypothetical protein
MHARTVSRESESQAIEDRLLTNLAYQRIPLMNGTKRASTGRTGRYALALQTWFSKRRAHRGQALVELAMVLPIMLVLFASALDLGRLYYSQITIDNAAKEGALEAARDTENLFEFDSTQPCDADTNRVICLVENEAKGSLVSISRDDVSLSCSTTPCPTVPVIGNTVTVTVTADFMLVSPILSVFFGGQAVPIAASSIAQIEVDPRPGLVIAPTPTPTPAPTPAPTPTPTPTGTPEGTPTPTPTPSPTPVCLAPSVSGQISITPGSGKSAAFSGGATLFTMTAPTAAPQADCPFTYTWSFGDGINGTGDTITHQYQSAGNGQGNNYTVLLVISTPNSATWSGSKTVKVTP